MELAVGQAQPGHQRAQMQNRGFGDTVGDRDGGLTQDAKYSLGIKPADPALLEQPGQRRLAQACGLGRGGGQRPQIQDPLGGHVVAHREQLRVIAPELLAGAVAQAHALVLKLFSQARPLPQRNHGRVASLDGPEQVRVCAQGTVNLIGSGRDKAGEAGHTKAYARAYARAATPVTAAQVWKAWVRAARYWTAGR